MSLLFANFASVNIFAVLSRPKPFNFMKFLITSDNHLGYKERDPVLSMDSFNTFEEILCIANIREVDIIVQGGDLFHENRPSRFTLAQTISYIKKYTFGNRELNIKCNKRLNYEDPNINISIPIVAIHGNHDDPTGMFSTSALDVLESSNLINYLGKCQSVDFVEIEPLIFNEEVALYLLGNIRDRRLYRNFLQKNVSFLRPKGAYYNILVVHQNRVPYGIKDYLPHEFLPTWFDLVVYGHEHESLVLNLKDFILLQPGSTVRTSLAENESFDKFIYIFDSKTHYIERIPLKTVRPFVIQTLDLDTENPEVLLAEKVELILESIQREECMKRMCLENKERSLYEERIAELVTKMDRLALVRIKGKIRSHHVVNNYKFGLRFKDRVANPSEILRFSRERRSRDVKKSTFVEKIELLDIVKTYLDFKALSEEKFKNALSDFILKDDKNSLSNFFVSSIRFIVEELKKKGLDDIEEKILDIKKEMNVVEEMVGNVSEIEDKGTFTDFLK